MAGGTVNRTLLSTFYQNAGDVYDDNKTEGAFDVLADQTDANWLDYAAHKSAAVLDHPDLSVTTAKIALLAVTAAQIANATITAAQIADAVITSAKIVDGTLVNADINAAAAIAWSKISKSASSLTDLATRLASDLTGTLAAAQLPAFTGGEVTSSAGSANLSLTTTGVAPGTYNNVTVDAKGRVSLGSQVVASASQSGDLSAGDWIRFNALVPGGLGSYAVPAGQIFSLWGRYSFEQDPATGELVIYEI